MCDSKEDCPLNWKCDYVNESVSQEKRCYPDWRGDERPHGREIEGDVDKEEEAYNEATALASELQQEAHQEAAYQGAEAKAHAFHEKAKKHTKKQPQPQTHLQHINHT